MQMNLILNTLALLIACIWSTYCKADESHQNLNLIYQHVEQFLGEQLEEFSDAKDVKILVSKLDSRLKLDNCNKPFEAEILSGSVNKSRVTVGITCPGEPNWTVRLPVKLQLFKDLYVAANNIKRGEKIMAHDLTLYPVDINKISHAYFTDFQDIQGMVAKRNIQKGSVIKPTQISREKIVQRGQSLKIIAKIPGMEVQSNGVAMQDGARGDRISVKNSKSKRIVEGIIVSQNSVEVTL